MKNTKRNKLHLITAFLDLLASVCFMIAAGVHNEIVSKGLFAIASVCFLISSIGFFSTYAKNKKAANEQEH